MWKTLSLVSPILLVLSFPAARASEPALALTFDAAELKWGPCPDFFPKGCQVAVLHGDPSKDNADIFFKVPGKTNIPDHWHTSEERMVLVSGELRVSYEGQPVRTLKVGSYAYGPAKLRHQAACVSQAPCILFIAFEAPVDAVLTETT